MMTFKSIIAGAVALGGLGLVSVPADALTVYSPSPLGLSSGVAAEPVIFCRYGRCRYTGNGYRGGYGYGYRRRGVCHYGRCRGY